MGTRSLTRVYDNYGNQGDKELVCIYRQYDGYPAGLGNDLYKFLKDFVVVDGFGSDTPVKAANGMGCLAAQLVKYLKDGIGNIYLYPPGTTDVWEEYEYRIRENKGNLEILAYAVSGGGSLRPIFSGSVAEMGEWLAKPEEEQEAT